MLPERALQAAMDPRQAVQYAPKEPVSAVPANAPMFPQSSFSPPEASPNLQPQWATGCPGAGAAFRRHTLRGCGEGND
jgi:hypothetical protein